jgi:uncharacterized protein YcfJ
MRNLTIFMTLPILSATACAEFGSSYTPILDGTENATYHTDLEGCQNLASNQSHSENTIGAAVVGGVFGGALADHEGDMTSVEGALVGAVFGLIGGMIEEADTRKSIVLECMKGRDHRVVG